MSAADGGGGGQASKRRRLDPACPAVSRLEHPLGVLPEGNRLLLQAGSAATGGRQAALGALGRLPDALLMEVLSFLGPAALGQVAAVSRYLYACSHDEDLWRALSLRLLGGAFVFTGSWRYTLARHCGRLDDAPGPVRLPPGAVFSDLLFQSWLAGTVGIDPAWGVRQRIAVHDPSQGDPPLTAEQFVAQYDRPGTPVLLKGLVAGEWEALALWDRSYLAAACGPTTLEAFDEYAGALQMTLANYLCYADQTADPRPLYVFESRFVEKFPALAAQVGVPSLFDEDLFSVLGAEARPDYRWLLVGPARTGTNFHVDPNYTSAWNAVISGRKKWVMFPPHVLPPGVAVDDAGEVVQPDSVCEWFAQYYEQVHSPPYAKHVVECLAGPGDVVYIPRGWWHLVLNLEETIAVTQNFVSRANLSQTLRFLRSCSPRHINFAGHPGIASDFETALAAQDLIPAKSGAAASRTSLWDKIKGGRSGDGAGAAATSSTSSKPSTPAAASGTTFKFGF